MHFVVSMLKGKLSLSNWMQVYLFSLATSLYALGLIQHSFNIMLLVVMVISIVMLPFKTPYFRKKEVVFYALYLCMFVFAMINGDSFRLGTFLYAGMFIFSFCFYNRLLDKGLLKVEKYYSFLKFIIYAYCVTLILQQFMVLCGLNPINQCWKFSNIFKLNSLAHEPSYIAGSMLVFMYSFLMVSKGIRGQRKYSMRKNIKADRLVWISFFYVMITCGSTHALMGLLFFGGYISLKYWKIFAGVFFIVLITTFIFHNKLMDFQTYNRLYQVVHTTLSLDTKKISEVDLSSAARINPIIYYIEDFDFFNSKLWIGNGIDYSKKTTIVRLLGHTNSMEQGDATGGLFPAFFGDYGLICGLLFLLALKQFTLKRWASFPFVIWLFFFIGIGFNTYMQWLFFSFMGTTLYFEKRNTPQYDCVP